MIEHNKKLIKHLQVPNWTDFQHYNKRNPPWIKLHTSILSDYDFTVLSDATQGHLMKIWLLASKTNNKITNDASWIKAQIHAHEDIDLEGLISAGFLEPYDGQQGLKPRGK